MGLFNEVPSFGLVNHDLVAAALVLLPKPSAADEEIRRVLDQSSKLAIIGVIWLLRI